MSTTSPPPLTPGAQAVLDALSGAQRSRSGAPGVREWLLFLLQRFGPLLESLSPGLEAAAEAARQREAVARGDVGVELPPATLLEQAAAAARERGREQIAERDLAAAVLAAAGHRVAAAGAPVGVGAPVGPKGVPGPTATPTLDRFGRDLIAAAAEGALSPVVGREQEIDLIIETLCRRTKRNPLLVGPAGTGKTAIVEGLAQRIQAGQVPAPLKGVRLIAIQPSSIIAGGGIVGEIEKRMQAILREASQPGIVLFIDEVHSVVGSGGLPGTTDLASQLKPALARGDFACIAATTDDEFRRYIEEDRALERRFQPIRIGELSPEQTLAILRALRDQARRTVEVEAPDDVLRRLVEIAAASMPNRRFPDKAVDLFDQTVAYARRSGHAAVTVADAEAVAQRMLGVSLPGKAALDGLRESLTRQGLLQRDEVDRLVERLEVTTHGFDVRVGRPNAVLLLSGKAASRAPQLAGAVAAAAYGSADRVVHVDFGRLMDESDIRSLLGAPPSFVGYADRHALDAVIETPWTVVLCERIDLCHPAVRAAFTPALSHGVLTDMRGRRIYFSDAVVILTVADDSGGPRRAVGFSRADSPAVTADANDVTGLLGDAIEATIDLVITDGAGDPSANWITAELLPALAAPLSRRGIDVVWDPSLVRWLEDRWAEQPESRAIERLAEHEIATALVRELQASPAGEGARYVVRRDDQAVRVEVLPTSPP